MPPLHTLFLDSLPLSAQPFLRTPDCSSDTKTVELLLITIALVASVILALTPTSKGLNRTRYPYRTIAIVITAIVTSLVALVLSFVALVLGWTRGISLDALAGVVFAIAPALIQLPRATLNYAFIAYLMRTRKSLNLRTHQFRYIRFGNCCGYDNNAKKAAWTNPWNGLCAGTKCEANMYIRILPSPGHMPRPITEADPQNAPLTHWYGHRVGHSRNFVQLRDLNEGITSWWWDSVSSAVHLVDKPSQFYVKNRERMLNVLAVLSDIISIGDLVFKHRQWFLSHQLMTNNGIRACVTSTPGVMCNKILTELNLEAWGHIGLHSVNQPIDMKSRTRYGILFMMLAEKSEMFAEKAHWNMKKVKRGFLEQLPFCGRKQDVQKISGQDVLDTLVRLGECSSQRFYHKAGEQVDEWLEGWGFRKASFEEEKAHKAKVDNLVEGMTAGNEGKRNKM